MRSSRRTGVLAIAASLALTAGVVTAVVPASANLPGTPAAEGYQLEGTVTLTTGTVDEVTFGTQKQALNSTCSLPTTGSILSFTGFVGTDTNKRSAGFTSDRMGVNELLASFCNKVDAVSPFGKYNPETLEINLGTELKKLKNLENNSFRVTKASLDIEVRSDSKGNKAVVEATAIDSISGTSTIFTLTQGTTEGCIVSDNGNCQFLIAGDANFAFDTLRLKAVKGSFSLQGGSPATATSPAVAPTTFELGSKVTNLVPCDNGTVNVGDTSVKFVGNADPDDPCVSFGAVLTANDTELQLLKSPTTNPSAQFVFEWPRTVAAAADTVAISLPAPFINFDMKQADGTTNADDTFKELLPCSAGLATNVLTGEGANVAIDPAKFGVFNGDPVTFPDLDTDSTTKEWACVVSRTGDFDSTEINVTDTIFAIGDLRLKTG